MRGADGEVERQMAGLPKLTWFAPGAGNMSKVTAQGHERHGATTPVATLNAPDRAVLAN